MAALQSRSSRSRRTAAALLWLVASGCATLQSADSTDSSDGQDQSTDPISEDASPGDDGAAADAGDGPGAIDAGGGTTDAGGSEDDGSGDGVMDDGSDDGTVVDDGSADDGSADDGSADDGSSDGTTDGTADDGTGDGTVDPTWEPAGNTACGRVPPSGPNPSIENAEDGNDQIARVDNRIGYWFSYRDETDATSMVDMPAALDGGANSTMKAIKVSGKSAASAGYGPGFGFSLYSTGASTSSLNCPYDASAYTGISFYIRGTGITTVDFVVLSENTVTKAEGGTCTTDCDDHFGKAVAVTSEWKKVTLKWSELAQAGWGSVTTFKPERVAGLAWSVAPGATFDLRVDEIEFVAP